MLRDRKDTLANEITEQLIIAKRSGGGLIPIGSFLVSR